MSRVSLDVTGWLLQESTVSLTSLAGADSTRSGSFGQHLEQAQRSTGASRDAYSAPGDGNSPRPTERSAEEYRQHSPCEDSSRPPRSESSDADSRPASATEDHAESPSSQNVAEDSQDAGPEHQQEESLDDRRDHEKEQDHASDAAAAGVAVPAAQVAADRAEKAPRPGRGVKSAAVGDSDPADGKPAAAKAAAKKPAGKDENAAADPTSAAAQTSESGAASLAAVDGVSDAGGGVPPEENAGDDPNAKTAILAAQALANSGGASTASTGNAPAADAQTKPVDAAAQVASAVSALRQEDAAEGRAAGSGGRRTGLRPGERIAGESQTSGSEVQVASVAADAPLLDAAVPPADSGPAEAVPAAAGNGPKVQTSQGPTNLVHDAKAADPVPAGSLQASASDGSGQPNEEAAKSDAADRARFVQRVAQAFESAADRAGQVRLRLHPPELGSLRLDLTVRNGLMNARLETETESARNMLLQELPALKERLAEHQIKVESFDIQWQGQAQGGLSQHPGDQTRWQTPSAGYAPGTPGSTRNGAAPEAAAAPRRISPGTSFDVVI
jgi:flagellar hook-length control protein FliK